MLVKVTQWPIIKYILYDSNIHFAQQETTNHHISIWKFNSISRQAYSLLPCKYDMVLIGKLNNIKYQYYLYGFFIVYFGRNSMHTIIKIT